MWSSNTQIRREFILSSKTQSNIADESIWRVQELTSQMLGSYCRRSRYKDLWRRVGRYKVCRRLAGIMTGTKRRDYHKGLMGVTSDEYYKRTERTPYRCSRRWMTFVSELCLLLTDRKDKNRHSMAALSISWTSSAVTMKRSDRSSTTTQCTCYRNSQTSSRFPARTEIRLEWKAKHSKSSLVPQLRQQTRETLSWFKAASIRKPDRLSTSRCSSKRITSYQRSTIHSKRRHRWCLCDRARQAH